MKNAVRLLTAALALASGCAETPVQPATGTSAPARTPTGTQGPTPVPAPTPTSLPIPTQSSVEALFRSIEDGDFEAFSRLIDGRMHVSTRNKLGETLLYVAAEKGQLEVAKLLLAKGADAKALTPNGETVLHAASMIESSALMTALIDAGAEINAANRDGETPLYWAAMTGTFLAVKALADAGANLDVQDLGTGNTALHAAASHSDIVLIHYLLSKNVRTDIRNNGGLTALDLAKAGGRTSAVRLLEK
ncbi:MAG TPA: ankyrin repeat domain-containing protein [Burkholderiales bacterium]|nr:ankyrin repeat domain-containing protein [Burkholderiales bacterium]